MLLLTTRGGSRYRKLPEGTITPLRQAQQTAWAAAFARGETLGRTPYGLQYKEGGWSGASVGGADSRL